MSKTPIDDDKVDEYISFYCNVSIPDTHKYKVREDHVFEIFWGKNTAITQNVVIAQDNGKWYFIEDNRHLKFSEILEILGYDDIYTVMDWTTVCKDHLRMIIRFK